MTANKPKHPLWAHQHRGFHAVEDRPAAGFQIAEPQAADADAQQFGDLVAERLEHHADLAFRAVVEHDLDAPRASRSMALALSLPSGV
jgi:hypothetical protein